MTAAAPEETRPMLWGPGLFLNQILKFKCTCLEGADYLQTDSMFLKWGLCALPPNLKTPYQPPRAGEPVTPCWYLMKKMEEKGLFYGSV